MTPRVEWRVKSGAWHSLAEQRQAAYSLLAEVVGHNLSTRTTETEIELNFAVVKIKHKVIRKDGGEEKKK